MAEGFARTFGSDVLVAESAGLAPARSVAPLTHKVMMEKNIDLAGLYPKDLEHTQAPADLIINMSGYQLPLKTDVPIEDWLVPDPIGEPEEVYRAVRDQIEERVRDLVEWLRSHQPSGSSGGTNGTPVDTKSHPPRQ